MPREYEQYKLSSFYKIMRRWLPLRMFMYILSHVETKPAKPNIWGRSVIPDE